MIVDEKDGIKIAENPEEAFWHGVETQCKKNIDNCKHEEEIQKHILKLAETKLVEFTTK